MSTRDLRRIGIGMGLAFGLAAGAAACGSAAEDQRTDTVTSEVVRGAREALDAGLVAQLDSGNVAMRGGDPQAALVHYRRATRIDPGAAAAWFGVYMGAQALGDVDAAEEALERARAAAPRASLLDPDSGAGEDPSP